jgi:phospholipid/cholesterol/gamma-HCH transport system ATP-binding protein
MPLSQSLETDAPAGALAAVGLGYGFEDGAILKGVDLSVARGEIVAIAAHGGAGKTTLFRLLLGLMRPHAGSVTLLGEEVGRLGARRRVALRQRVGAAYQEGALFGTLSLLENVMFPLVELADLDRETVEIVARMKLQQVELLKFRHMMPAALSGAMVRRAAIARAIALDPQLLICDDIFSGLDGRTQLELIELIQMLRDAFSMTVVALTSQLDVALALGDRTALLDEGRIVACAPADEIRGSEEVYAFLAGEDPLALAAQPSIDQLFEGIS